MEPIFQESRMEQVKAPVLIWWENTHIKRAKAWEEWRC